MNVAWMKGGSVLGSHLDARSGVSPNPQIVRQVRHALRLGMLEEGDQLPTVKEVVEHLAINPNTVLKAYKELEPGLSRRVRASGPSSRRPSATPRSQRTGRCARGTVPAVRPRSPIKELVAMSVGRAGLKRFKLVQLAK